MNKKFLILIVATLVATAVLYYIININSEVNIRSKSEPIDKEQNVSEPSKTVIETKINVINESSLQVTSDTEESNIQTHQFHQDSVLDYKIASSKFNNCIEYFNPVKSFGSLKKSKAQLSDKQKRVVDKHHLYCESIKDQYPYYFSRDLLSGFLQADPNYNVLSGYDKFSEKKFKDTFENLKNKSVKLSEVDVFDIGNDNAYSIIGVHKSLRTLFKEKIYPELRVIIGGDDQKYLTNIVEYAEYKIACDLGADCGDNSNMMVNYCRKNDFNCGLSFMQMYQTRISNGQQLDIIAVENYLLELFAI